MNKKLLLATVATGTVAAATYALATEKRIHDLENSLHRQQKKTELWKRNFERATPHLTPAQLLSIVHEMKNDSKFERIVINL